MGKQNLWECCWAVKRNCLKVRAADAKEVGVGNPAEETSCRPNKFIVLYSEAICQVDHAAAVTAATVVLHFSKSFTEDDPSAYN